MKNKKAVLVGINYPGTEHELNGCVNDVNTMADLLIKHFGFDPKTIRMLTDESATTVNIIERLRWLVQDATPGDVLFFHYSGHGSQLIDTDYDSDKEPDGKDEIICPIDLNWRDKVIKDDDLKHIFNRVPAGVNLTVVLDCCHSGSGIDQENYFRPLGLGEAKTLPGPNRVKEITMPADIANRGRGLNLKPKPRKLVNRSVHQVGLLVSGCQPQQTSADAWIHSQYMGAATYFLVYHVRHNNYQISYKELVEKMNVSLRNYGYSQRPELNGNEELWDRFFLQSEEHTSSDEDKDNDSTTQDQLNPNQSVPHVDSPEKTAPAVNLGIYGTGNEEDLGEETTQKHSKNGNEESENGSSAISKAVWFTIAIVILVGLLYGYTILL